MKPFISRLPILLAALALAGAALADDGVVKSGDGVLQNSAGMTLYTFDKDVAGSGKSACTGPCAVAWPPLAAPARVTAPYSIVTRDDGARQLAYNGKPLYLFAADKAPGQRGGDNVKQIWHVAKE
ncbi:MAG TPA: hypothetical protein DCW29_04600 [Janthinobacterium sp.]|nr:hypothetical protein [Janthinobacterium sp.]